MTRLPSDWTRKLRNPRRGGRNFTKRMLLEERKLRPIFRSSQISSLPASVFLLPPCPPSSSHHGPHNPRGTFDQQLVSRWRRALSRHSNDKCLTKKSDSSSWKRGGCRVSDELRHRHWRATTRILHPKKSTARTS
ncbi:hypothetical protein KM043_016887 [Ampulex compressa]|nr:hypothetical protein KM043_016887 [Ampulex compressa]